MVKYSFKLRAQLKKNCLKMRKIEKSRFTKLFFCLNCGNKLIMSYILIGSHILIYIYNE